MFSKLTAVLLSLAVLPIFAQYIYEGECPTDVDVVQDFDLDKYLVNWFEIQRYEVYFQRNSACSQSLFERAKDGSIVVRNSWSMKVHDTRTIIEGSVVLADPSADPQVGKLIVSFNKQKPGTTANYLVLGTDYTNYAVAWHCYSVGSGKIAEVAWVMSRTTTLHPDVKEKVNAIVDKYLIKSQMKDITQDDERCGY